MKASVLKAGSGPRYGDQCCRCRNDSVLIIQTHIYKRKKLMCVKRITIRTRTMNGIAVERSTMNDLSNRA